MLFCDRNQVRSSGAEEMIVGADGGMFCKAHSQQRREHKASCKELLREKVTWRTGVDFSLNVSTGPCVN